MKLHFEWDQYSWRADVTLASWRGFASRRGAYGSQDGDDPSDGSVRLVFAPEGRGDEPLTESEIALAQWFLDHEVEVSEAAVTAIFERYSAMQEEYGYDDEERGELMPDISKVEDLRSLIGLHSVFVHQIDKDGIPYVGFELGCTWDAEHGVGVLMHGTRAVEVGGADTAFLLWIAEGDAEA